MQNLLPYLSYKNTISKKNDYCNLHNIKLLRISYKQFIHILSSIFLNKEKLLLLSEDLLSLRKQITGKLFTVNNMIDLNNKMLEN